MAKKIDLPAIYECQVAACKAFFIEQLPCDGIKPLSEEETPTTLKNYKGSVFDITGFNAYQVVGVLHYIVNKRDKFKNENPFCLLIKGKQENVEFEAVFQLKPNPTKNQPGNGIVFLRHKGEVEFQSAKAYDELNKTLQESYTGTRPFAEDIKRVFKNNKDIGDENFSRATLEVYMLWLFEIARRLVNSAENTNTQRMKFDGLPIGSAIAGLVKLLELDDGRKCNFNVFSPKGKFDCFTGSSDERKKAIYQINDALEDTTEKTENYYAQELKQLFCSETAEQDEKQLNETFGKLQIEEDSSKEESK